MTLNSRDGRGGERGHSSLSTRLVTFVILCRYQSLKNQISGAIKDVLIPALRSFGDGGSASQTLRSFHYSEERV